MNENFPLRNMMTDDQSFTGNCPTCGQRYYAAELHQLRYQLKRLVDAYLIMCDYERDALVEEAELILDKGAVIGGA